MPEQHGVGHRAEERPPPQDPGHLEPGRVTGRDAGGDQADRPDGRCDQIEPGIELGTIVGLGLLARSMPVMAATRAVRASARAR